MFLLAYIGQTPVVGLPGCVMYNRVSIFDLVIPRILAGEVLTRGDIKKLARGGLCLNCESCSWPKCGFGKY
jgi:molybdopterin biosynthesis enzyme